MSKTCSDSRTSSAVAQPLISPPSLRDALRQGTSHLHESLDSYFPKLDFDNRAHYQQFLSAHAEAITGLETALERAGVERVIPDWTQRRRAFLVVNDLTSLGLPVPSPSSYARTLGSTSAIIGTVYVLEGSRMGNSLIYSRLRKSTDSRTRKACSYFEPNIALWKSFLAYLELPGLCTEKAVSSAQDAFTVFSHSFKKIVVGINHGS